jgi:hypothetical protein
MTTASTAAGMPPPPKEVQLRAVPARRGAVWIRQGFGIFFARPLAFSCLLGLFLLASLMLALLPWIGLLVVLASLPLVTLAFMLATQQALRGQSPGPAVFVLPLRVDRQRTLSLVKLGLLYAAGTALITLACHWIDGGQMAALQEAMAQTGGVTPEQVQAQMASSRLQQGLLWRMALSSLLSLLFWHAPGLVYWGGQGAAKSLFFSAVAIWRTRAAFAVYGVVGMAVLLGFGMLVGVVLALLGQPQQWAGVVVMPGMLTFASVFYASLFFSFADSFDLSARGGTAPGVDL